MASIDSKKLLPPDKRTGAITTQKFLVPVKNLQIKPQAEIPSGDDLKPVEKETGNTLLNTVLEIEKKVISVEKLLQSFSLLKKQEIERKRKLEEKKRFAEREAKLEKKETKGVKLLPEKANLPGQSIVDRIFRFLGFTLLGFLFNKYNEYLPKLLELSKNLTPIFGFVESFATGILNGAITFIDFGYKAYDKVRDVTKSIGGENALKTFDEFSSQLNTFINLAIIAGMSTMGGTDFSSGQRGGPGRGRGGGRIRGDIVDQGFFNKKTGRWQGSFSGKNGVYRTEEAARRYARRFGRDAAARRFGEKGVGYLGGKYARSGATNLARKGAVSLLGKGGTKAAIRILKPLTRGIPVIGGLLEFGFALMEGDNAGRAAFRAVGSTLFGAIGAALGGPFALFSGAGGAWLGGIAAGKLYDYMFNGKKASNTKAQGRAAGGPITRAGKVVGGPASRSIRTQRQRKPKLPPQKTIPGKDIGGQLAIEKLFTADEPGRRSSLRALKNTSAELKKINLLGNIMGASVDLTMGQLPDKNTYKSVGDAFGNVIQGVVDQEVGLSLNGLRGEIFKMAEGGSVPGRSVPSRVNVADQVSMLIQRSFESAVESKAFKIFQDIRKELNLKGGPDVYDPSVVPDGGPLSQDQQEAFEKIRKIAEKVGSPNPSVTAAIAMLETGWLSNPNSVYFASGKTNPFGQTGRGPRGSVVGTDGQEHAVYNSLEEGVKAHVDRWKSSYIGKTPQEIIESIRTGRGVGAPGMYNVSPSWTSKVLSTLQSGTQPQPSSTPSKGAVSAVLPKGNPVFTSGFGSRWGKQHRGIDIGVDANSPVTALQDGKVIDIYRSFGGHGDGVVVQHSDGTKIVYGHVNSKVVIGDKVKKGQIVATVKGWFNAYGNKDNTHLHLERYVGGSAQDPTGFLNSVFQQKKKEQKKASISPTQPSSPVASLNGSGILNEDTSIVAYERILMYQQIEKQIPVPIPVA